MRNTRDTKTLVMGGLMAAIVCVLTFFVHIPIPMAGQAYVNAGDAGVYLAAVVLGGWPGALAAAVGSSLADLLHGAAIYVAPTFVIKGAMALVAAGLLTRGKGVFMQAFAFGVSGLLMTAGYFTFELLVFDSAYAMASLIPNLMQAAGGAILGVVVSQAAQKLRLGTRFF